MAHIYRSIPFWLFIYCLTSCAIFKGPPPEASSGNPLKQSKELNVDSLAQEKLECQGPTSDGLKFGIWTCRNSQEQLIMKITFHQGQRDGEMIIFNKDGSLDSVSYWKKNRMEGLMTSYELKNGSNYKLIEAQYSNGLLHGPNREFTEQGQLISECFYQNGMLDGSCKTWYPNGVLRSSSNYQHSQLTGLYQDYYENGKLRLSAEFEQDRMIKPWKSFSSDGFPIKEIPPPLD